MATSNPSPYTLIIRRNTQVARAANLVTGSERWNLSVAEYSISLVSSDRSLNNYYPEPTPSVVRFRLRPPDGVVSAFSNCGVPMWEQDLGSPIARVWQLVNGRVHEISLFDTNNVEMLDGVEQGCQDQGNMPKIEAPFYFGIVKSAPYIIPSASAREELHRLALTKETNRFQPYGADLTHYGRALYLHDVTITNLIRQLHQNREESLEPGSVSTYNGYRSCPMSDAPLLAESTELQPLGYGNEQHGGDQGWYIFKSISRRQRNAGDSKLPTNGRCKMQEEENGFRQKANIIKRIGHKFNVYEPVSGWWRVGTLALCVMLSSMSSVILVYMRRYRRRVRYTSSYSDTCEDSIPRLSPKPSASSVATSSTELLPDEPSALARKLSSLRTTSSTASQAVPDPFSSKFFEDFIPEKILGKGGYGVVFNCRHRLDDRNYAVKRIAVSDTASAVERVKREAKAMAKLDHPGIIRYFHTWIERPPEGWQQAKDKEILKNVRALYGSVNPSLSPSWDSVFHLHVGDSSSNKAGVRVKQWRSEEVSSLSGKLMRNGSNNIGSWEVKGDAPLAPSEQLSDSWADDTRDVSENKPSSSSDSDSSCEQSNLLVATVNQDCGLKTNSSGIVFENESCSKEGRAVGRSKKSSSNTSSGALEPPAVLFVSKTELHTCKKTKDYIYLYIQMELCQELTLHNWLLMNNHEGDRQLERMRNWLAQLVCAIDYIHEQGLIHRDLKPQNIFFSADGMNSLKIGDLGLATNFGTSETGEGDNERTIACNRHTGNVGTRLYMSPEQLNGCAYDQKIDVFSLGLIFTEMLIPFQTVMERSMTLSQLQNGVVPKARLRKLPSEVKFISWLTQLNANVRPSCREVMQCDYLREELNLLGMPFTRSCANFVSNASKKRS